VRVIIAGPRDFTDYAAFLALVHSCEWKEAITTVLSGACRLDESAGNAMPPYAHGADGLGERYAVEHGIQVERHFAKWYVPGKPGLDKSAGPRRNREMAESDAHGLVAAVDVPPYPGSGTWNMIAEAVRHGLEIHVPERYVPYVSAMELLAIANPQASASRLILLAAGEAVRA
jgi:hypothetical protein